MGVLSFIECMGLPLIHSGTGLNLPLAPETGVAVLGAGLVVLTVLAYDIYRQHYAGEGS